MSRPSKYSKELGDKICDAIATSNKGLNTLCNENEEFPYARRVYEWLSENETFAHQYARAREIQAEFLADEIIEIADDSSGDTKINKDGEEYCDHEFVQRSRLKVDARKWKASKLAPKKYGDKLDVTTDGEKINKGIDLSKLSDTALNELIKASDSRPDKS